MEKDQQGRNFDQLLRRASTRRPDCESADDLAIVVQTNTEGIFQGRKNDIATSTFSRFCNVPCEPHVPIALPTSVDVLMCVHLRARASARKCVCAYVGPGKKYVLRCKPPEAATEWVKESSRHAHEEKRKLERMTSLRRVQSRLQVYYEHSLTQSLIAFLILANFASTMIELQMPDKTEKEKSIFASLDSAFTM